jgi:ABC-type lipoprotein export system ATPase subunit
MVRLRSLPRLALRRMRRNWRLLSSVAAGTLVAAAILSTTAIYADAIRDLGLQHALRIEDPRSLDVRVAQSNVPASASAYATMLGRQDSIVADSTSGVTTPLARQGASGTFYATLPGDQPDLADNRRLRANIIFRSGLEDHIELLDGVLPPAVDRAISGPIEALIGAGTAERLGVTLGDEFDLHPFWDVAARAVTVRVVGVAREADRGSRYWGAVEERLDARERTWETLRLWVPEETFFGATRAAIPTVTADYLAIYEVDFEALDARNALTIADGLQRMSSLLNAADQRSIFQSGLEPVLRSYDQKLFFTRIPLLVLLLQIGAIVAYYLVMVSTMLIERQAAEMATMRSRGATTTQLLGIYGVEGTLLAAAAAAVGPTLAGATISLLGPTPAFRDLSGGSTLDVYVGGTAYLMAGVGAFIAFASLMLPAWRATRSSVVEFKRGAARPGRTPMFMRYYLDVIFVLVVAALFWRLSRQEELFTETLFGETQVDPVLLATPAVFMVTVGVVFLRLFPLALWVIAWLVGWTRSVAILVGMRSLVRQPAHYTRLILLLMFATGVGMFGATFSATLGQSYVDRANYEAGADMRAVFTAEQVGGGDAAAQAFAATVPAEAVSLAARTEGHIYIDRATNQRFGILAVDASTFADVAFMRDDFADEPLPAITTTLEASRVAPPPGPTLPEGTQQIGMWLRFPDIRGRMDVQLALRDATGAVVRRTVGSAAPIEEHATEWRFYSTGVNSTISRTAPLLQEPVEVVGVFFSGTGRIAQQRAVIHAGPLLASPEPPPPMTGIVQVQVHDAPWPGASPVASLAEPEWGVIQAVRLAGMADTMRPVDDQPPGGGGTVRYEWFDAEFAPGSRGIGIRVEQVPIPMYLGRETAGALGLEVGDTFTFAVVGRYLPGSVAGFLDYFPTWDTRSAQGFALADATHLLAILNAAAPDRVLRYSEAWFAVSDRFAALDVLEPAGLTRIIDREALEAEQQEDPLIAAGWSGILAVAFGSVLLLSAIGFIVYSYLTAQQRGLEFAILRTLGFSRGQIFSVVAFEHLFVIVAGMGLGTLVGLRIGQIMMGFLATDETGATVIPPFILGVSWTQVFIVWGILGSVFIATIAAVVALYFRLAVHRVLRIGDVTVRREAAPETRGGRYGVVADAAPGAPDAAEPPYIHCEDLFKIYKSDDLEVVALRGLDLQVTRGEMMAIVGASGSGKSTLAEHPRRPRPALGRPRHRRRARPADRERRGPRRLPRRDVGFVWQQTGRNLIPYLTAEENVTVPMALDGRPAGAARERARLLLEQVGLGDKRNRRPTELSGGEQQRVAIAVALANNPPLLLADEPTGELDSATADEVFAVLEALNGTPA